MMRLSPIATMAAAAVSMLPGQAVAGLKRLTFETSVYPYWQGTYDRRVPDEHVSGSFVFEFDQSAQMFKDRRVNAADIEIGGYRHSADWITVNWTEEDYGSYTMPIFSVGADLNLNSRYPKFNERGYDTGRELTLYALPDGSNLDKTVHDFTLRCNAWDGVVDFNACNFAYVTENYGNFYWSFDSIKPRSFAVSIEDVDAVPEPATWAMMIGGFGLIGGIARRRDEPKPRPA